MKKNKQSKGKIDVIVKYFYPVAAGIETNVLETYSVLQKEGWDVTIHASNLDYTSGKILASEESVRNLKVKRYPLDVFGFSPDIKWGDTDLIALHNFDLFYLKFLLKALRHKITGKKKYSVILTPHGGFNPEWRVFSFLEKTIKSAYTFSLGVILINLTVDKLRAVSEWEKREMVNKGISEGKIKVIPNGIEDEAYWDLEKKVSQEFKNKVEKLGQYIIQIGRIYPIKNYETTIRALPLIPSNIKYVIVGPVADNAYLESLKKLSKELGVEDRVVFLGIVRGADKYYLIKKSQTMVHMAIWESFCNVVHEALSQGLIPVVADNTALPYLIRNNVTGFLVETKDSKALAEKINYVLENRNTKEFKEMSLRNRKFGLEESWTKVALKMDQLYKLLLK